MGLSKSGGRPVPERDTCREEHTLVVSDLQVITHPSTLLVKKDVITLHTERITEAPHQGW